MPALPKRKSKLNRLHVSDYVFIVICIFVIIICLLPLVNLLARSLSGSEYLIRNKVSLWPKGFNLTAYEAVFKESEYRRAFVWTVFLTVVGTLLSLTMTTLCAFPLIFDKLKGRGAMNIMITITMFFNAGTMPNYLLFKQLHMLDTPYVLLVPFCLSVFNMIIMRSFFYGIPDSLRESAELDGASFFQILTKIYLPLSKPVIATLALYYAVGRWNGYSDALMFAHNNKKNWPLQLYLWNMLQGQSNIDTTLEPGNVGYAEQTKAAVVMFSTIPILCIYPWLQKYFIHGVTVGAVKE
ncbi:MAG: carbohydrate ABC transporter permease [Lachnospiraceae bacterium]|nr:carbohydrate ABC transporter permease [Lachnospiraceae bacterium]